MTLRRGACPTLSEPMQTGDGLLARLNPVEGRLSGRQLAGLAQAAERFGNGILEITARGSLQLRGLTAASAVGLGAEVEALGIALRAGLPLDVNPLAGLDAEEVADPRKLAREIGTRVEALGLIAGLGPKVSVTVDGSGALGLGGLLADVKLEAVAGAKRIGETAPYVAPLCPAGHLPHEGGDQPSRPPSPSSNIAEKMPAQAAGVISPLVGEMSGRTERGNVERNASEKGSLWLLRVGGTSATARVLGQFSETDATEIAVRILQALADRGRAARSRDLTDAELAAIAGRGPSHPTAAAETMRPPVGRFALRNGAQAMGFALSYGQIESAALAAFAEAIGADREIRLARGRGLVVLDVGEDEAPVLAAAANHLGLVTVPADPRLSIAVCAGKPACASAHLATRHLADRLAAMRPDLLDGSFTLHVSGCGKQCARPAGPSVTLTGTKGGYDLGTEGATISPDLEAVLSALADEQLVEPHP
jgi:precorrin-3B synthase